VPSRPDAISFSARTNVGWLEAAELARGRAHVCAYGLISALCQEHELAATVAVTLATFSLETAGMELKSLFR
jgi:hypothetical protein